MKSISVQFILILLISGSFFCRQRYSEEEMEKLQSRADCELCLSQNHPERFDQQSAFKLYCMMESKEKLCADPEHPERRQKCLNDCERVISQDMDEEKNSIKYCLHNGKCKRLALYCQIGCRKKPDQKRCIDKCWKDY